MGTGLMPRTHCTGDGANATHAQNSATVMCAIWHLLFLTIIVLFIYFSYAVLYLFNYIKSVRKDYSAFCSATIN